MLRFTSRNLLWLKPTISYLSSTFHVCSALSSKSPLIEGGREVIDGQNISYVKSGKGQHVVLCLPGALGSAWTDFKPQLEQLDGSKFTLIAWDPPGYGYSRPPDRDFSGDFFHKDAEIAWKLMKHLKYTRFSMLGWSDGGITAMIIAANYPQYVNKCVVWGSNAYVTPEDVKICEKVRDIDSWSEKMRAPMVSLYGEEYFRKLWNQWVDAIVQIYDINNGDICSKEVNKISCPFLIVHGAKDPMIAQEHPKYLASYIYTSRLHIFPDGRHNVHLRYAEEFNKIVSEFLLGHAAVGGKAPSLHSPL